MRIVIAAVGAFLTVATLHGQRLEFEVATDKVPAPVPLGTSININLGTFRNGTLTMTNVTLTECVLFAYSLISQDQVVGPKTEEDAEKSGEYRRIAIEALKAGVASKKRLSR